MLLILISWIYILFASATMGVLANRILRIKQSDFICTTVIGLFTTTLFAGFWALFHRINWEFHCVFFMFLLATWFILKNEISTIFTTLIADLKGLPTKSTILLAAITILILAQCASAPFILDNESYYLQTIKWLNEYGYVNGIANLHIFLGQQSGWHLSQSVFNFSFAYARFNDLSGFFLFLGNVFAFIKLNEYKLTGSKNALIVGLLPITNLLLLQFISAPSPDLPIYILTFLIAYYFVENFYNPSSDDFKTITILSLFAIFIKPTAIALALFPFIALLLHSRLLFKSAIRLSIVGLIVFILFLSKNFITSGHPLFPIVWSPFGADFAVPNRIIEFHFTESKLLGFRLPASVFDSLSAFDKFQTWLRLPKLHGFFNWLSIVIIVSAPFFLWKLKRRAWWSVYVIMCLQMILLASSSPQYRFFLNFILVFGLLYAAMILNRRKLITPVLYIATIIAIVYSTVTLNLSALTNNTANMSNSRISLKNIIVPHPNSKADVDFIRISDGQLHYYSPVDHYFFWGSGDGPLPCVNSRQIKYFKKYFRVVPQQRSEQISDGFYARTLSPIE